MDSHLHRQERKEKVSNISEPVLQPHMFYTPLVILQQGSAWETQRELSTQGLGWGEAQTLRITRAEDAPRYKLFGRGRRTPDVLPLSACSLREERACLI